VKAADAQARQALNETKHLDRRMHVLQATIQPATEDIIELKGQVLELSQASAENAKQMERLEATIAKLKRQRPDNSFKTISFLGIPKGVSEDEVAAKLQDFMKAKFSKTFYVSCGVYPKFNKTTKMMEMSSTAFVEFASGGVRDRVFEEITSKEFEVKINGKKVDVKKARSKSASDRNAALHAAKAMIKKHFNAEMKDVEIKWTEQRGVIYKGDFIFNQPGGDSLGEFYGAMAGVELVYE
jgi:hypothetical protein